VDPVTPADLAFGLDGEVNERDAVVERVLQPVHRVHIARTGNDDCRGHRDVSALVGVAQLRIAWPRTARFGVSPRLMRHCGLVARDDEPRVAVGEGVVERERLFSRDAEHGVDTAIKQAVDDRLGDSGGSALVGSGGSVR